MEADMKLLEAIASLRAEVAYLRAEIDALRHLLTHTLVPVPVPAAPQEAPSTLRLSGVRMARPPHGGPRSHHQPPEGPRGA